MANLGAGDTAEVFASGGAGEPTPATAPLPMLLTVKDVEVELQLGRTRVYELVRSGRIPVITIGRIVRIPREALQNWIQAQAAAGSPAAAVGGDPDPAVRPSSGSPAGAGLISNGSL